MVYNDPPKCAVAQPLTLAFRRTAISLGLVVPAIIGYMPRSERYNPYQLPFDFAAQPVEIGQHVRVVKEPYVIRQPADAAAYLVNQVFVPFHQFRQEQLYVLLLDIRNTITHDVMVYKGTVNSMNIRVAELFMEAVKVNAPSILLSHLHPSGAIDPSKIYRSPRLPMKLANF